MLHAERLLAGPGDKGSKLLDNPQLVDHVKSSCCQLTLLFAYTRAYEQLQLGVNGSRCFQLDKPWFCFSDHQLNV
jgi:hypothetical protein